MSQSDEEVNKILVNHFPMRNVKTWGVIEGENVFLRGTCRRCGDYGQFLTREAVNEFKRQHENEQGVCPFASEVKY